MENMERELLPDLREIFKNFTESSSGRDSLTFTEFPLRSLPGPFAGRIPVCLGIPRGEGFYLVRFGYYGMGPGSSYGIRWIYKPSVQAAEREIKWLLEMGLGLKTEDGALPPWERVRFL